MIKKHSLSKIELFYYIWLILAILLSFIINPYSLENKTRFLVIIFILLQIIFTSKLTKLFSSYSLKNRFIIIGVILAIFVEGFHMISSPVFLKLRITETTKLAQGLEFFFIDLIYTVPCYIVIFYVIWLFINKYKYKNFNYIFIVAFAQTIGDGGLFFLLAHPLCYCLFLIL